MRRIYPGAEYAPIPEAEGQAPIVPVLVIYHTIVGAAAGAESTMRGEAWTGEAHIVLPFAKPGRQLVPFDRRADCNWQVNSWTTPIPLVMADGRIIPAGTVCGAISIETEDDGTPEDTEWTAEQVEWLARFTAWAHDEHGIPLDTPATPFHPGVGYHSLPGKNTLKIWDEPGAVPPYGTMLDAKGRTVNVYNPWTNTVGKSCPGAARIAQFPHVLELARRYAGVPAPIPQPLPLEDDMPRLIQPANDPAVFLLDGLQCSWVRDANVLADLLSAGIVPATKAARVTRRSLSAFVLVGPAPAYTTHPPSEPERTKPTDFAGHRPNG